MGEFTLNVRLAIRLIEPYIWIGFLFGDRGLEEQLSLGHAHLDML